MIDVGKIVRDVNAVYMVRPLTAKNLLPLVRSLEGTTERIADKLKLQPIEVGGIGQDLPTVRKDFRAWQGRLGAYRNLLEGAIARGQGDNPADVDVLWSVTAPLILGLYGGQGSDEPQRTADLATPFILSNQIQVAEDFQRENLERFFTDLKTGAAQVAGFTFGSLATAAALAGAAWFLFLRGDE